MKEKRKKKEKKEKVIKNKIKKKKKRKKMKILMKIYQPWVSKIKKKKIFLIGIPNVLQNPK